MPLTREFKETVQARLRSDRKYRKELLREGVECLLAGDLDTGKAILRDYINATIGFEELSRRTRRPAKSLMRMLSPSGNPQARNLFEVRTATKKLVFPFSKVDPTPTVQDPITKLSVDAEVGREAFTYVLHSGRTGTVHAEQVLEYNQDPAYLRDLLLYRLTLDAQKRIAESPLSKR